jgi:peptidoglycan/LPS O-acetylase OafA/YrhL
LRGLASIAVLLCHLYLIFNPTRLSNLLFEYGPLRVTIGGGEAVILFFILSGFVLSLPFYSNNKFNYGQYLTRRICRIYIPYLVSVTLAIALKELFYSGHISSLSNWFNDIWDKKIDVATIFKHLIFIGTFNSNINDVVWSLVHEMRISIIFPIIMFFILRMNWKASIGGGILLSVLSVLYANISDASFWGTELYSTFHYADLFILGAVIAKHKDNIVKTVSRLKKRNKLLLFLLGFICYTYVKPSFVLRVFFPNTKEFNSTVLDSIFVDDKMSIPVICFISVVGAILISSIMHYLVEKPSIKLGKHLTKSKMNETIAKKASA